MAARYVPLGTAALAFAVVWPILFGPGIPLFAHDWIWSPDASRILGTWQLLLSPWRETGLGEANSAITLNPLGWLKVASGLLGSGRAALDAYLFLSVWAAIGGAYDIARRALQAGAGTAFASAALFAASPLLFDKIASGQSSYWAATAAFAWALSWWLTALQNGSGRDAAKACALFALATLQMHFLLFAWCAYVAGALAARTRRTLWLALWGAAGAASLALPELFFLALAGPEHGAGISPAYRMWIRAQSSHPLDAIAMLGYAARYAEHALGNGGLVAAVRAAAFVTALLAAVASVRERRAVTRALALLALAGLLAVMGAYGPFGGWVAALSLSVPSAWFVREYYHAAVLYALGIATLAPLALARVPSRVVRLVPFALALVLGIASWSGGLGRVLPFVAPPNDVAALRAAIAPVESRALFLPAQEPLAVAGDALGGNDGTDWIDARHPSVYAFNLPPPVAGLEARLAAGDATNVRDDLERLGIGAVILREAVRSLAFPGAQPAMRRALDRALGPGIAIAPGETCYRIAAFPRVGIARALAALPANDASGRDANVTYVDDAGSDASDVALDLVRSRPIPRFAWIARRDAPAIDAAAAPASSYGIITTRPGAAVTLAVPRAGDAWLWAPAGLDLGARHVVAPQATRVALEVGEVHVHAGGPAVIAEVGERVDAAQPSLAPATIASVVHDRPWRYRFRLTLHGLGAVVLRENADDAWTLRAPGLTLVRRERADGYANLWLVRGDGTYDAVAEFAWWNAGALLLAVSGLVFTTIAGAAWLPAPWSKRPVSRRDASRGS